MSRQAGVFYREFDLSQIAVADGNLPAAIVVASRQGFPYTRVLCTTTADYLNYYGSPDPKISFAPYCALAYLEKGNQLWVVRATGAGAQYGCWMLQKKAADTNPVLVPFTSTDPANFDFAQAVGGSTTPAENLALIYPTGPGGYSKYLKAEVVSANLDPVAAGSLAGVVGSSGGTLAAASYDYAVTAINAAGETAATALLTVTVASGTANKITLTWGAVLGASGYKVYGRTKSGSNVTLLAVVNDPLYVDTGVDVPYGNTQPAVSSITTVPEFTINFYDSRVSAGKPIETYVVTLGENLDGFGRQTRIDDVINTASMNWRVVNNTSMLATLPTVKSIAGVTAAEGNSGAVITDSDIVRAWDLFADPEQVYVRVLINGGYSTPAVQKAMIAIAESRQDSIAFLDMPSNKQRAQDAVDYRNNTLNANTNRGALFAQDLLILDKYNSRQLYVPSSGHMAALATNTAFIAAPWYPMAGLNRGQLGVLGVRNKYSFGERELLKTANINYIRDFPGQGIALFEQITLQGKQSALSWISVRFLMDEIQLAARKYLLYSDHELNDDFLRRQIVGGLNEFLQDILNRRGLKRFLVVCDERNNSAQATGEGKLNVDVYLAPTLPVDQIILNGVLTRQDAVFTELIGKF